MNLHFITSVSREYWDLTAKYCIPTWNLPGRVTVYVEQTEGDIKWVKDIPFNTEILTVPTLPLDPKFVTKKFLKFWGKAWAQIYSIRHRGNNERIVWLDADIEQIKPATERMFAFKLKTAVAMMNSGDAQDCWESGIVVFNEDQNKLGKFAHIYHKRWEDQDFLETLWRPYDAQVLGNVAESSGYTNLCKEPCPNALAVKATIYADTFHHWINKENKELLRSVPVGEQVELNFETDPPIDIDHDNSSNISSNSTEREESRED
jgi:hypothetical protein